MVRSLYSGVAGMTTQQKKMDVIGNNIANVSTYGFKSSRVTFRDVYYQTSSVASGPSASHSRRPCRALPRREVADVRSL